MHPRFTTAVAAAAFALASAGALANDSITVTGAQPARAARPESRDATATNACFAAFVNALMPGNTFRVRTVIPVDGVQVFRSGDGSVFASYTKLDVEMSATVAGSGELLATSRCTVDRDARVVAMSTQVTNAARLAGLTLRDIKLAMASR